MDEPTKIERKEGITYYLCEHLETGEMKFESALIWLGPHKRVVLCPLCMRMELGNVMITAYSTMGKSDNWINRWWRRFWKRERKTPIKEAEAAEEKDA
jgi:hypothetical protein